MKLPTIFAALVISFCPLAATDLPAGLDPVHDDIIVYRSTESQRGLRYREGGAQPGFKTKGSDKRRSYIVLNMTTGDYREISYFTYDFGRMDGRRVLEKRYRYDRSDMTPASLFESDPEEKKNYLVLSLVGTGGDFNYDYDSNPGGVNISTDIETLDGRVKTQKIRTEAGVVECLAPSKIKGKTALEYENTPNDSGLRARGSFSGKRSLKFDKRLTRDALDAAAHSLEDAVLIVAAFLESKGYEDEATSG